MPKRSNEYQKAVYRIYKTVAENCSVEESVLLEERGTGAKREVDILLTQNVAGSIVKIAIECRDHTRKQDETWIDSLIGKYSNLNVDKIIAISRTEFSRSAIGKAAQHNIELITVDEAENISWGGYFNQFRFFGFRNRPLGVFVEKDGEVIHKILYTWEGEIENKDLADIDLSVALMSLYEASKDVISINIFKLVEENWERISKPPYEPRQCSIEYKNEVNSFIELPSKKVFFDRLIWVIGTKFVAKNPDFKNYKHKNTIVGQADLADDLGNPIELNIAGDSSNNSFQVNFEIEKKDNI